MKEWKRWMRWSAIFVAFLFLFPFHIEAAQKTPADPYVPPSEQQNADSLKTETQQQQNDMNGQPIPAGCKAQPDQFGGCPGSYYIIDYVGIKDLNTFEFGKGEAINWVFNFLLDLIWGLYTTIIVLVIYFFRFSYTLDLMPDLSPVLKEVLGRSETFIWESLFAFLFVISFIYVLVKFLQLQRKEGYMILFRNIVIVAFASFFLSNIPVFVENVSKGTALVSDYILAGFLSVAPEDKKQKTQGQNLNELAKQQKKRAVDMVSDTLWSKFYFEPYLVLEFGSVETGKKYVNQLFNYGKDDHKLRQEWFWADPAKVDPETGIATSNEFKMVTDAGMREKFIYELIIISLGGVFSIFLVIFCWKILKWFFIGIGRALFSVFALLFAMWPERSFRDVVNWILSTGFAFFMRIFLTCVLAIGLTIFAVLQNIELKQVDQEYEFLVTIVTRGLLSIASFVAIWMVMKEVQAQMEGLVGVRAREPNASDFMNTSKVAGRGMVIAGSSFVKGGWELLKGTSDVAGNIAGVTFGKNFAEIRRKSRLQKKAEKAMKKMGLDPYSHGDRMKYFNMMKEKGEAEEAAEMLSHLSSIPIDQSQGFPELKSDSSPIQKLQKEKNPKVRETIEENGGWVDLPNYDEVADELIKQRQEEVKRKLEKYQSLPFYKRWFTQKPEFHNPTQEEINKAYLEQIQKKNKVNENEMDPVDLL